MTKSRSPARGPAAQSSRGASLFDELVQEYDSWYGRHALVYESELAAVRALDLHGFGLEIGVGSGRFACPMQVEVGLDPSLQMLRLAKTRKISAIRGRAEQLPFKDGAFDYALMIEALSFVTEPAAAIQEAHRVLRDGGSMVVCEVPRNSRWGSVIREKRMIGHRFYALMRPLSVREIQVLLTHAGFEVVEAQGTLSYGPRGRERFERPTSELSGKSFICLRAECVK